MANIKRTLQKRNDRDAGWYLSLPKELIEQLGWEQGEEVMVSINRGQLVVRKDG